VPLTVTVVNPSYSLSEADKFVIVSVFLDTVLETVATLTVVTPVLLKAMFPEYVPTVVDAAKRTSIDVDAMAPQASGEMVKLVLYPEPLEISKPLGAAKVRSAVRLLALTLKLIGEEAVP
jgi:hypothetical protein